MKACHICEKIVRTEKSIACLSCKKAFCFYCTARQFPEKASHLLGKRDNESFATLKVSECFACLRECRCHKCRALENVVYAPSLPDAVSAPVVVSLLSEEQPVPESGLFRGRRVGELPFYLQRLYLKKKVLYSKHEISCLSNDKNIPEQQNADQPDDKLQRIAEEKERKEDESPLQNNDPEDAAAKGEQAGGKGGKNGMDEEEEQADDYESEFASRRAAHLHNQTENSAINDADVEDQAEVQGEDPNNENMAPRDDSIGDPEDGENGDPVAAEEVGDSRAGQNNASSGEEGDP